jgi:hypothetical protein
MSIAATSTYTYNSKHRYEYELQRIFTPNYKPRFLDTKISFEELHYIESLAKKAIMRMKSYKNKSLWVRKK